jgi:hypothetical protein
MALRPEFGEHTINELTLMFQKHQINLEPGFQRRSVWKPRDRQRLIQSIVDSYPFPSVFLYKRTDRNGRLVYDVIDGKQRLESIFMFSGVGRFSRHRFGMKLDLGDGLCWYDWRSICKRLPDIRAAFQSYKIQTVEVTGDLAQIIDVFVRINATGMKLTSSEKRHAQFYTSPFLKEAEKLVVKHNTYLRDQKILTRAQLGRMKGTELFSELLMSIHKSGPIDGKIALDRAVGNESVNGNTLARLTRELTRTIRSIRRMFPKLRETRFRNSAEFYTLALVVWEMDKEGLVLVDKRRNLVAFELLRKLSTGVDQLREKLRKAQLAKPAERLYSDYLLTVLGGTDKIANRERRRDILRSLLWSLYERKVDKRSFTAEQRRIIWNSDDKRLCAHPNCPKPKEPLRWEDFTVDHIIAYVKGGKTDLPNAQLMHRSCNSSKGAR